MLYCVWIFNLKLDCQRQSNQISKLFQAFDREEVTNIKKNRIYVIRQNKTKLLNQITEYGLNSFVKKWHNKVVQQRGLYRKSVDSSYRKPLFTHMNYTLVYLQNDTENRGRLHFTFLHFRSISLVLHCWPFASFVFLENFCDLFIVVNLFVG